MALLWASPHCGHSNCHQLPHTFTCGLCISYRLQNRTRENTLQYENSFSAWDQEPLQTSISFPAKELRKSKRTGQIYTPSFLVSSLIPSWYVVRDSLIRRYFKSSQWIFIPWTCLTAFYACLNFFCTHGIMSGTAQLRTWYLFQTCHPVVYMWCFLGPVLWEGLNHNSVFTSPLHDFRHSLHLLLSYQRPTAYFISIWRSCSTCLTTSLAFTTTEFWVDGFGELRYSFWVIRASPKATTVYIRLTPLYTSNYWIVPDILSASQSVSPYSSAILSSIYFF